MNKGEFNLLREPWIHVTRLDGTPDLLSLRDTLAQAHAIKELSGDLPTQDFALLRLLLAVLHAVFGKQPDEKYIPLAEGDPPVVYSEHLIDRWQALWGAGAFPMHHIDNHLTRYEKRFFLFHPQHAFYQVPQPQRATEYTAAKLNGAISESGNKLRMFSERTGAAKNGLTYAEAARWLVHIIAFDDSALKATPERKRATAERPPGGVGWVGELGGVYAVGSNLFETLLLNLVLLRNGASEMWGVERPIWALSEIRDAERITIAVPDNQAELLTLQSRRITLIREKDIVTGYFALGGDYLPQDVEVFEEQYTLWNRRKERQKGMPAYYPRRHDSSRHLWRDLTAILVDHTSQSEELSPGVVTWLEELRYADVLPIDKLVFKTVGVTYDANRSSSEEVLSDSLTFSADFLSKMGFAAVIAARNMLSDSEALVEALGTLARTVALAAGDREGNNPRKHAAEQGYHALDLPFRRWLENLQPLDADAIEQAQRDWREQSRTIIRGLGRQLVEQAGPAAFAGRVIKRNNKEVLVTAPGAYNMFLRKTK